MITNQPRSSLSFRLRLGVVILTNISALFLLLAIVSNNWGKIYRRGNAFYVGLWNVCNEYACEAHTDIIHAKVFLVVSFILAFFCNILFTVLLWYGVTDVKKATAKVIYVIAIFELAGIVMATIYFTILCDTLGPGFAFGWIAVILCCIAGTVAWIHSKKEPDAEISITEISARVQGGGNVQTLPNYTVDPHLHNVADPPPSYVADPPPSYVADPPPSSIIVS